MWFGLTGDPISPRIRRREGDSRTVAARLDRPGISFPTKDIGPIAAPLWPCGTLSMRNLVAGLVPLAAFLAAAWLITLDRQGRLVWDHWDEVKRGVLYRSGQLSPEQLTEAVKRYNIRTIINLQWPGAEMQAERGLAGRLGIDFVNLPMPGDGLGEEWQFREILKILDDPDRQPALVHCARGHLPHRSGGRVLSLRTRRLDPRGRGGRDCDARRIITAWCRATSTPW